MKIEINLPDTLHSDTKLLVIAFAEEMGRKLCAAEKKYGYSNTP